jgi:hypothetical protein
LGILGLGVLRGAGTVKFESDVVDEKALAAAWLVLVLFCVHELYPVLGE